LVTGAATGIGAAAVQVLTAAGASVVATHHRAGPPLDSPATWLQCDVTDEHSVRAMTGEAARILGGLDVLVHAAGTWQPGFPGQLSGEQIDALIAANITGTIHTNQAAYEVMRAGGGRIINFGSAEAVMGSPFSALYAATKGAVQAWTRSIAKAWAGDRITANALAPAMQTPGAERLREFLGPDGAAFLDQQLALTIPLGGALGDPVNDLGPVLVFLAGEGSHFITGQLIAVDGGLLMLGS
jgi:NAD(P)-dependent dehydrogenase (short-subunit alcohol dehydrogenase family)